LVVAVLGFLVVAVMVATEALLRLMLLLQQVVAAVAVVTQRVTLGVLVVVVHELTQVAKLVLRVLLDKVIMVVQVAHTLV
jgi:hypothetical protein